MMQKQHDQRDGGGDLLTIRLCQFWSAHSFLASCPS